MDDEGPDLYAVLGCDSTADARTLRTQFRRLAVQFHPDKNPDNPAAEARFKEVSEAYEILSDETRRAVYDRDGHRGLNGLRSRETAARRRESAAARSDNPRRPFGDDAPRWQQGNGGANPFAQQRPQPEPAPATPPPPVERPLMVSLEELLHGCTRREVTRQRTTPINGPSVPEHAVDVVVEPGWKDGTRVTFEGAGEGQGDVIFVVHEMPHPRFEREGDDLRLTHTVSLKDSLCGGWIPIPTLDGHDHPLLFTGADGVIAPGRQRSIDGLGMPRRDAAVGGLTGERGRLVVVFEVEFPTRLAPGARLGLSALL